MIYTSIRVIRIGSIMLGFLGIILSFLLPVYRSCKWNSDESGTIEFVRFGYETTQNYIPLVLILLVFISGYFFHYLINKILVYFFSSLSVIFIFLIWGAPNWGATPCVRSYVVGEYVFVIGLSLVMLGTLISIHREKE